MVAFLIGLKREIFAECDLSGFLKLIIPHWAPLWHCGGWHKSCDSHRWAVADPGESFPSLCVLDCFLLFTFPLLLILTFHNNFINILCGPIPLKPVSYCFQFITASHYIQSTLGNLYCAQAYLTPKVQFV